MGRKKVKASEPRKTESVEVFDFRSPSRSSTPPLLLGKMKKSRSTGALLSASSSINSLRSFPSLTTSMEASWSSNFSNSPLMEHLEVRSSSSSSVINVTLDLSRTNSPVPDNGVLAEEADLMSLLSNLGEDPKPRKVPEPRPVKRQSQNLQALLGSLDLEGLEKQLSSTTKPKLSKVKLYTASDLDGCSPRTFETLRDTQELLNKWC